MNINFQYSAANTNRWGSFLTLASILILIGMVMGGISRLGIGYGWIDTAHQLAVALGGALVLITTVYAYRQFTKARSLQILLATSSILLLLEGILGFVILSGQGGDFLTGAHYWNSTAILGLVSASASMMFALSDQFSIKLSFSNKFAQKSIALVSLVLILLVSGAWLANSETGWVCNGWPLCNGSIIPEKASLIPLLHRGLVLFVGIYLYRFSSETWKTQRSQKSILTLSNSLLILYIAQGYVGALLSIREFSLSLAVLHEITAAMLVVVGSLLLVQIGIRQEVSDENINPDGLPVDRKQRLKDFLQLNKPVVVSLLLATTLAGMVMGYKGFPPANIILVTLLSGALAAGGSGAVNQYIDRDIDEKMTRTSKRPIPSGRLTPAEGLAFGVSALLISFYLMAGLVNMLAALLTLAGMIYYVYFYSILLKRKSVQNIVIGGGAGAIPPMVGWAAATGSLDLEALFLFLIIFLWTPPHFWALALTRKNEYAEADVPMMPVRRGDDVTRKLILQYTIVLVALTILMWVLDLAGWVYLIGAVALGAYLLMLAWQVWRVGRNRVYYKMYRHSNYYLLLLFFILAIDSILL